MNDLTISIFGNQIFFEVVKDLKLFSKYKMKFYVNFDLCQKDAAQYNQLIIFFVTKMNAESYKKLENVSTPLIVITKFSDSQKKFTGNFIDKLNIPFRAVELETKIVSLLAKHEFKKNSIINLNGYIINKIERKIKKNNVELKLTEKEIDFLILFSKSDKSLSRNFVLKNVWKYSSQSDTHTVETHIHRLRKKILEKFNDNNFIKNNDEGYYI